MMGDLRGRGVLPPPSMAENLFACIAIMMVYDVLPLGFFQPRGTGIHVSSLPTTSVGHQIAHAALFLGATFFLISLVLKRGSIPAVRWELPALVCAAVASTLWSLTPPATLKLAIGLVGTTILGVYIAHRYRFSEILVLLWVASTIMIMGCVAALIVFPENAVINDPLAPQNYQNMWRGLFGNKNQFGQAIVVSVITCLYCIFLFAKLGTLIRVSNVAMLALSLGLLVRADAVSSYVTLFGVLFGVASLLLVQRAGVMRFAFMLCIACIVILSLIVAQDVAEHLAPALGRDPTLTNRTLIWDFSFRMIEQRPILGYGYGAFWDFFRNSVRSGQEVFHAHNGFIQLSLDVGVLGVLLFVSLFVRTGWRCLSAAFTNPGVLSTWPASVLIALLIGNLAEANLLSAYNMQWWLFVLVTTMLARSDAVRLVPSPQATAASAGEIGLSPLNAWSRSGEGSR